MKDIKEMLGELTDAELQDVQCFIEAELGVRSDSKVAEKVQKLADTIQQIVDLDYTLRVSSTANAICPAYLLEDMKGTEQYRIIPDYHHRYDEYGNDEYGMSFGYIINKWNSRKGIWEDITDKCLTLTGIIQV